MRKLTPFGKVIRQYRLERGQTQLVVAGTLGVSVAFFSAIETGKKNVPQDLLAKVVSHFDLSEQEAEWLNELALMSQAEIKIKMEGLDDDKRRLVAGFARKFNHLEGEENHRLHELLGIG